MYFLAVFLPFFVIIPGINYLKQADHRSKAVGCCVLLLSGVSLLVEIYFLIVFWRSFGEYYELLNGSLGGSNSVGASLDQVYF
jgi:hypothetical protein